MTLPFAAAQRSVQEQEAWDSAHEIGWIRSPGGTLYNPKTHYLNPHTGSLDRLDEANRPTATADDYGTWDARDAAFNAARDAGQSPPASAPAARQTIPLTPPATAAPTFGYVAAEKDPRREFHDSLNANRVVDSGSTFLKNGVLVDGEDQPLSTAPVQLPANNVTAEPTADWKKYVPYVVAALVILAIVLAVRRSKAAA